MTVNQFPTVDGQLSLFSYSDIDDDRGCVNILTKYSYPLQIRFRIYKAKDNEILIAKVHVPVITWNPKC